MEKKNFLIGYGERLTSSLEPPKIKPTKKHPYNFNEAITRLKPQASKMTKNFDSLPDLACPNDEAVGVLTLHPAYLAKSYFPKDLLRMFNLRAVGSKPTNIIPEKWTKKGNPELSESVSLFVAGSRKDFDHFSEIIDDQSSLNDGELVTFKKEIIKFEEIRGFKKRERLKKISKKSDKCLLEVALHIDPEVDESVILDSFNKFAKKNKIKVMLDKRISAKGLCFLPVEAPKDSVNELDQFSFLRVARDLVGIRDFDSIMRSSNKENFDIELTNQEVLNKDLRVAIFDGGLPSKNNLIPWTKNSEHTTLDKSVPGGIEHGAMVTSAFLFGPIENGKALKRPICGVDHYRVLDKNSSGLELFDVLNRIDDVLSQNNYEFFNLSLGPNLPIEDDDVHVWTAKIDELLSDGKMLGTVAVGNDGDRDRESGNARVQVPADSVNAISIGASDRDSIDWRRASYSSIGPGRSPGVVKPDVLAFGGSSDTPFYVVNPADPTKAVPVLGTSFAAPYALRMCAELRTLYKKNLTPLSIKNLLVHHANSKKIDKHEVGWGKIPFDSAEIILSNDSTAKIIYQGTLEPGKYLRAKIPMLPPDQLEGKIGIKATFCFSTDVDPQDPINYTRSGLEITFRPDKGKRKEPTQREADSKPFFTLKDMYTTEQERRLDAHKWETVLHKERSMLGTSFNEPVFDIHYNARTAGQLAKSPTRIPYSLTITVQAPKISDFYDKIITRYQSTLEVMTPEIEIEQQVKI